MTDQPSSGTGAAGERIVYLLPQQQADTGADGLALAALWSEVWNRKWLVALSVLVFGILGVAIALLSDSWFRASVVLLPTERSQQGGLGAQLAQFGGVAALAGIGVRSAEQAQPLAVLKSREFAQRFIEERNLLTVLLADDWDEAAKAWKPRSGPDPDIRDAIDEFDKRVRRVTEDRKTGLVTLTIEWTDSALAASWANSLAERVNEQLRQRAIDDATANVRYLQAEMAATNVVSLQQSISRLLEVEQQKLMLARGNKEFAFRIIDHAQPAKKRFKPRRAFIAVAMAAIGGLFGIAWVLVGARLGRRTA